MKFFGSGELKGLRWARNVGHADSSSEVNRLDVLIWNPDLTVEQVLSTAMPPMQVIRDCRRGAKMRGSNLLFHLGMAALRHTADLHPTAAAFRRNFPENALPEHGRSHLPRAV